MKTNYKKNPGFDEIIFEKRNKDYGAYDLRSRYKSVASLSVLIGIFIGISLVISLSFTVKDHVERDGIIINVAPIPDFIIDVPVPEIPKKPDGLDITPRNYQPVVTEDTSDVTDYIPTMQELIGEDTNHDVNDSALVAVTRLVDEIVPPDDEPAIFVQEMPEFPGGSEALLRFIATNVSYPDEAIEKNLQGKVFLKFAVNKDGSVDRIIVTKGIDPLLDSEAVKVIGKLPKFIPGKQNGIPVAVWFAIPVSFQLKIN